LVATHAILNSRDLIFLHDFTRPARHPAACRATDVGTVADVLVTLNSGSIVEHYPEDTPFPSQLTLGWVGQRPVHVV